MRIHAVSIRNYRLHRSQRIDFDPSRTLIGGPNESGKSTLIEAMHRALFLKAKGNTEHHRCMQSSVHVGHPEVELVFESGGITYELKKRFGSSGSVSLASAVGALSGDAAEGELARLLGVEAGATGKVVAAQWSHLWVWQGAAGDDPTDCATAQREGLLRRLQQMGSAAAFQSDRDTRVANHFAELKERIYVQSGKPKAGSDLDRAERAAAAALEELAGAAARVQKLDSAAADLDEASRRLLTCTASLAGLEKQQDETEAKAKQLMELRQQEAGQVASVKAALARHALLDAAQRQILTARGDIAAMEASLQPKEEAITQLEAVGNDARNRADTADAAARAAGEAVRAARSRHSLAVAYAALYEKTEAHARLTEKAGRVAALRSDLAAQAELLAKLPKVDKTKLHRLQKLELDGSNALAGLRAMAAGIAVLASDHPVLAGDRVVDVGQEQILTEATEVRIGGTIRLRIQPGGGTGLAEARKAEADARVALAALLDSLGILSVREAIEALASRDATASRIGTVQAQLDGMDAGDVDADLQRAANELTATRAAAERLAGLVSGFQIPERREESISLAKALEKALVESEGRESDAAAARASGFKSLESAVRALQEKRAETEQQRLKLHGMRAQLDLLLATHGDDTARELALAECRSAGGSAQSLLKITTDAIVALQPELLEGDRARVARAIKAGNEERSEARSRIAVAKAALQSDGSHDPAATLAVAEARARSAGEQLRAVQRRSEGIALLDRMFREEQGSLARKFTQPLAERISGYLQCLFGAGVGALVELEDSEFKKLRLARPGFGPSPYDFSTLSGGAKEQTAAAVRLAMAEVLAADHGGCLPVVFDDAFAYSDPDRVTQLQRMLDLAAARGLQVIVLSCNPADYASLGAKTHILRPERIAASRENGVRASREPEA